MCAAASHVAYLHFQLAASFANPIAGAHWCFEPFGEAWSSADIEGARWPFHKRREPSFGFVAARRFQVQWGDESLRPRTGEAHALSTNWATTDTRAALVLPSYSHTFARCASFVEFAGNPFATLKTDVCSVLDVPEVLSRQCSTRPQVFGSAKDVTS